MLPIKLNQTLHGYKDGHRELGSSIELGAQDSKTLLTLSDVSGSGARIHSSGYLTGYPLPSSGLYALARTWPAPEMSRPGCVWTHTLLIDFSDLATINDPSELLRLFSRPEIGSTNSFKQTIPFKNGPSKYFPTEDIAQVARPLVSALYQFPHEPIISFESENSSSETAVLALWGQQWPRLRRSFRFCTMSASDRSTREAQFDLQILSIEMPNSKSRFTNCIEAVQTKSRLNWIDVAIEDIRTPKQDGLRQFLFQAGSDFSNGRTVFSSLCLIFECLEDATYHPHLANKALELIATSPELSEARALKSLVLKRIVKSNLVQDMNVLAFLVENVELLDGPTFAPEVDAIGGKLLTTHPLLFLDLPRQGKVGEQSFRNAILAATIGQILQSAIECPELLPVALRVRPELLEQEQTWSVIDVDDHETAAIIFEAVKPDMVLRAAVGAGRSDAAEFLVTWMGPLKVLAAIYQSLDFSVIGDGVDQKWLKHSITPTSAAEFLSTQEKIDRRFLLTLSRQVSPSYASLERDRDPWLQAIGSSKNSLSKVDELSLRSYLLARGLGTLSKNSSELIQFGFEVVDQAAAQGQLRQENWLQLERHLPTPMFWQDWDKCYRLRLGVADQIVSNDWPAARFLHLTTDDEVFAFLVAAASQSYRGRSYLRELERNLSGQNEVFEQRRRSIIQQILDY